MSDLGVSVKISGPLFEGQPEHLLVAGANEGLNLIAIKGQGFIQAELHPGHGYLTGRYSDSIFGGLVSDLHAQVDAGLNQQGHNVVYAGWLEGDSPKNARSTFKGYRFFRNAMKKIEALDIESFIIDRIVRRLRG